MSDFPAELFKSLLPTIARISDKQMKPYVREMFVDLSNRDHTPSELYDTMVKVAELPCERIQVRAVEIGVGDISPFMHSLCDVTRFYERPDNDAKYDAKELEQIEKDAAENTDYEPLGLILLTMDAYVRKQNDEDIVTDIPEGV